MRFSSDYTKTVVVMHRRRRNSTTHDGARWCYRKSSIGEYITPAL